VFVYVYKGQPSKNLQNNPNSNIPRH